MTRALILALVVLAAVPAAASGYREPTRLEKKAIAHDWARGTRPSCLVVAVSDQDAKWASLTWSGLRRHESVRSFTRRCPGAANGLAMLHKRNGRWRYITDAGSDGRRACPLGHVPTPVAADLKACLAAEDDCDQVADAVAVVSAPHSTSCDVAELVAQAYEAETDGEPSEDEVTVAVKDPADGLTYKVTCLPESGETIDVGCDSRRHRVTLHY